MARKLSKQEYAQIPDHMFRLESRYVLENNKYKIGYTKWTHKNTGAYYHSLWVTYKTDDWSGAADNMRRLKREMPEFAG